MCFFKIFIKGLTYFIVLFLSKNIIQSNYIFTDNNCLCCAEPSILNYTVAAFYLLSIENIFGW